MTVHRDLVVIGASAGGVAVLPRLIGALPPDLPASVLVVQHLAISSPRHLVEIVQRGTTLPVRWAADGAPLVHGEVLLAPPGVHLLVDGDRVTLNTGAPENHAKPSINRLFRSAAAHRGNRAIGVLLSGLLDDGVSGLDAIKWAGGVAIVQDPGDAEYPDLPMNALAAVDVDRSEPLDALPATIIEFLRTPPPPAIPPCDVILHAALDRREHAMPHTSLHRQQEESEVAMIRAVRSLEDICDMTAALAREARGHGDLALASHYDARVIHLTGCANRQRQLLLELRRASR